MMISVWYDPDCDEIWITDEDRSYARRSLVSFIDPTTGKIGIRLKEWVGADIVMTAYTNLMDRAGQGFLSAVEAKAYLDGEFAKQRSLDLPAAAARAATDLPAGLPVCISRIDGSLRPARADTYTEAFVVGLVTAPVAEGFVGTATRKALTLDDWTELTRTPSLALGQPYFLGSAGGLTTFPDLTAGRCLVRLGNATGPQTLAPVQADPILL